MTPADWAADLACVAVVLALLVLGLWLNLRGDDK